MGNKCCKCGADVDGITVHDFKFDEERTRISWHFCPNCTILVGCRLALCNLTPAEWKGFTNKAGGDTYLTHSDFYDDDGNALQPFSI